MAGEYSEGTALQLFSALSRRLPGIHRSEEEQKTMLFIWTSSTTSQRSVLKCCQMDFVKKRENERERERELLLFRHIRPKGEKKMPKASDTIRAKKRGKKKKSCFPLFSSNQKRPDCKLELDQSRKGKRKILLPASSRELSTKQYPGIRNSSKELLYCV